MTTEYKLDKSFGPVGSMAGFSLIGIGIIVAFSSIWGLILLVPGAFLGFTSTSTVIDSDKKRVKFSENLFGIIPTGKWIQISSGMTIGIKKSNLIWTAYSRSNQSLDIEDTDYRLVLFGADRKELMTLLKTDSPESALKELDILCSALCINATEW